MPENARLTEFALAFLRALVHQSQYGEGHPMTRKASSEAFEAVGVLTQTGHSVALSMAGATGARRFEVRVGTELQGDLAELLPPTNRARFLTLLGSIFQKCQIVGLGYLPGMGHEELDRAVGIIGRASREGVRAQGEDHLQVRLLAARVAKVLAVGGKPTIDRATREIPPEVVEVLDTLRLTLVGLNRYGVGPHRSAGQVLREVCQHFVMGLGDLFMARTMLTSLDLAARGLPPEAQREALTAMAAALPKSLLGPLFQDCDRTVARFGGPQALAGQVDEQGVPLVGYLIAARAVGMRLTRDPHLASQLGIGGSQSMAHLSGLLDMNAFRAAGPGATYVGVALGSQLAERMRQQQSYVGPSPVGGPQLGWYPGAPGPQPSQPLGYPGAAPAHPPQPGAYAGDYRGAPGGYAGAHESYVGAPVGYAGAPAGYAGAAGQAYPRTPAPPPGPHTGAPGAPQAGGYGPPPPPPAPGVISQSRMGFPGPVPGPHASQVGQHPTHPAQHGVYPGPPPAPVTRPPGPPSRPPQSGMHPAVRPPVPPPVPTRPQGVVPGAPPRPPQGATQTVPTPYLGPPAGTPVLNPTSTQPLPRPGGVNGQPGLGAHAGLPGGPPAPLGAAPAPPSAPLTTPNTYVGPALHARPPSQPHAAVPPGMPAAVPPGMPDLPPLDDLTIPPPAGPGVPQPQAPGVAGGQAGPPTGPMAPMAPAPGFGGGILPPLTARSRTGPPSYMRMPRIDPTMMTSPDPVDVPQTPAVPTLRGMAAVVGPEVYSPPSQVPSFAPSELDTSLLSDPLHAGQEGQDGADEWAETSDPLHAAAEQRRGGDEDDLYRREGPTFPEVPHDPRLDPRTVEWMQRFEQAGPGLMARARRIEDAATFQSALRVLAHTAAGFIETGAFERSLPICRLLKELERGATAWPEAQRQALNEASGLVLDEERVPRLADAFVVADTNERAALFELLAHYGKRAVPAMVDLVVDRSVHPSVRRELAAAIEAVGTRAGPSLLGGIQTHGSRWNRITPLLRLVGAVRYREGEQAISDFLKHPQATVREEAVLSLHHMLGRDAESYLLGALEDTHPRVRQQAVALLAVEGSNDRRFLELLHELLTEPPEKGGMREGLVVTAVRALTDLGNVVLADGERAETVLVDALKSSLRGRRSGARPVGTQTAMCEALAVLGTHRALAVLELAARDGSPALVEAAEDALATLEERDD